MMRGYLLFVAGVCALPMTVEGATLTTNSPCTIAAGQSQCTVNVSWSLPEAPIACLWLTDNRLFSCGGQSGTAAWAYTPVGGTTFILRGHQSWSNLSHTAPEYARRTAYGVHPALSIPATNGNVMAYYPFGAGGYRGTYNFGDAATGQVYVGANAHYFARKVPGMVDTYQVYWPTNNASPTLDVANTSVEEFSVKHGCQNNTSWVWLNRYKGHQSGSVSVNRIRTVKATYTHNGQTFDITNVCNTSDGQPYVPYNIPAGAYRVQVWGYIYQDTWQRKFYWDSAFEHRSAVVNGNWAGGGSNSRRALSAQEGWWDDFHGWAFGGSGEMGTLAGQPGQWPTGRGTAGGTSQPARPRGGMLGENAGYFWDYLSQAHIARSVRYESYPGPWPAP